jgi:hypothetical protein
MTADAVGVPSVVCMRMFIVIDLSAKASASPIVSNDSPTPRVAAVSARRRRSPRRERNAESRYFADSP